MTFEITLQAREERRRALRYTCPKDCVGEIDESDSLWMLEKILDRAQEENKTAVLFMWTRSCGRCKEIKDKLSASCKLQQNAHDILLLTHELRDSRDDLSPIAQLYRVKHVPSYLVFQGGALKEVLYGTGVGSILHTIKNKYLRLSHNHQSRENNM